MPGSGRGGLEPDSGDLALAAAVVDLNALSLVRVVSFPVHSVLVRTAWDPDGLTLTPAALARIILSLYW